MPLGEYHFTGRSALIGSMPPPHAIGAKDAITDHVQGKSLDFKAFERIEALAAPAR